GDGLDHVAEIERALFLGHASMERDLEQQVAKLVLEVGEIAARDGIGHLIGFLKRMGRDGSEGLFEVPGATAAGRAQRCHDLNQAANVTGGLHCLWLVATGKTDRTKGRPKPRPLMSESHNPY